jgi:hypothetical protein
MRRVAQGRIVDHTNFGEHPLPDSPVSREYVGVRLMSNRSVFRQ